MPTKRTRKKARPPTERHAFTLRLSDDEMKAVTADLAGLEASSGFTLTPGAYMKQAVKSFARLRRIEGQLRGFVLDNVDPSVSACRELLR